jgi:hypothetical protein
MKWTRAGKSLLVGAMAVGALTFGTAGIAGAATSSTTATPVVLPKFNCANADKALTRITKAESRISAGLPKLSAAEAKATAAGKTVRAARIERRIKRFESTSFVDRLHRRAAAIEAKCDVPAPSAS